MHYDWERLADGVYRCRLPFLDVTVGVVQGSDHVLLIDSGTTLLEAGAIAEDVSSLTGACVSRVLLTHHHFDHILGAAAFTGAQILAAPAVTDALTLRLAQTRAHALAYGPDAGELDRAIAAARRPDRELALTDLDIGADLDLGDRTVRIEHPGRGHTSHDLIVVIPATTPTDPTVVFCGDLIEESADPAIEAESDLVQWPRTLDRVLALGGPNAVYVPGHGATVDAGFVARQRDWLTSR